MDNVVNKNNVFFGKKVVVSGLYDKWTDRSEIARKLQILGADIDTGVTHRTNILIAGRDKKVEMMNKHIDAGKNAVIINEMELIRLLEEINK